MARLLRALVCICLVGGLTVTGLARSQAFAAGWPASTLWQRAARIEGRVPVRLVRPPPEAPVTNGDHGAFLIPAAPPPFLWWYTIRALRLVLGLSVGFLGLTELTDEPSMIQLGGSVLALVALVIIPTAFVADSMFMYLKDRAVATLFFL